MCELCQNVNTTNDQICKFCLEDLHNKCKIMNCEIKTCFCDEIEFLCRSCGVILEMSLSRFIRFCDYYVKTRVKPCCLNLSRF